MNCQACNAHIAIMLVTPYQVCSVCGSKLCRALLLKEQVGDKLDRAAFLRCLVEDLKQEEIDCDSRTGRVPREASGSNKVHA
jgi:hypothetical protein